MCITLIIWSIYPSLILPTVLTWYCKSFYCLLICPLYLSYGSGLVYREYTVRTAHVLNSVAVHFKSAEQIVILTSSVLARSLMSSSKLRIASYALIVPLCHSLYIAIVSRNHICTIHKLSRLKHTVTIAEVSTITRFLTNQSLWHNTANEKSDHNVHYAFICSNKQSRSNLWVNSTLRQHEGLASLSA